MKRKNKQSFPVFLAGTVFLIITAVLFAREPLSAPRAMSTVAQCPFCFFNSITVIRISPASCIDPEITTYKCNDCLNTWDVQTSPAKGHSFNHAGDPATCTSPGTDVAVCADCGYTVINEIPATGHSFPDEWTVEKEPAVGEPGLESRTCTVCGEKETREISALTQDPTVTEAPTPTSEPGGDDPDGPDPTTDPGGDDPVPTAETPTPTVAVTTPTPTRAPTPTPTPTVTGDVSGDVSGESPDGQATPSITGDTDPSVTSDSLNPGPTDDPALGATVVPGAETGYGDPQGDGTSPDGTDPRTDSDPDGTELLDLDPDTTPSSAPAIIAIIVGILGVGAIVTTVTIRGRKHKNPVKADITDDPGDGFDKPDLEEKTVVTYFSESKRAARLLEALDKRPFLLVKKAAPGDEEALCKLIADEKPKLILIEASLTGGRAGFETLWAKLKDACEDSGFAVLFASKEEAEGFGVKSLKENPKYKGYACLTSSDEAILTKIILPVYKPDFSMDNILDGIGNIAESFGIPALSTFIKVIQVGGSVREAIEEHKLDKGNLTEMFGNISEIFGFDFGGDLADAASFADYEKEKHFSKEED